MQRGGSATTAGDGGYEATIRWTTHGVAHVRAADVGSLGFGQGYACAADHVATIAGQVTKTRSERARFHGRGPGDRHVHSDLGYLALGVRERAERMVSTQPDEVVELVTGYAAGINAWLSESAPTALPAWCRDAPWVRPVDAVDLFGTYVDLAIMASGRNLATYIGSAVPPGSAPDGGAGSGTSPLDPGLASNAWAFGREATANGRGMVMANPHFPWYGEGRFWECHLTIPGELDVYGVSLIGTPLVQIGFNEHVAWSHTFSRGHRFTVYKLDLVPGRPTAYRYGEGTRDMVPSTYSVEASTPDGGIERVEATLWSSHYGPMVDLPMVGWSESVGFTYRDANIDNDRFLSQVGAMNRAADLDAFKAAHAEHQGLPWANTLAADDTGRCWYTDSSTTPNLSAEATAAFCDNLDNDLFTQLFFSMRVALLDGSDPVFEWVDEPGGPGPGLIPHDRMPELERYDHVFNSNDPYWLPHADVQLPELSPLQGRYRDRISTRTRMNALLASGRGPVAPSADGRFTPDDLEAAVLGNHSLIADLVLDGVIERARRARTVDVDGRLLDLEPAVAVLASWDRRFDARSVGAVVFRELLASFPDDAVKDAGPLFADAYDPTDPIAGPRGLAAAPVDGDDPIAVALAHAMVTLERAGIALDAPLGDVQYVERAGRRFPLHGGNEREGIANIVVPDGDLPRTDLEPAGPEADAIPGRTERTGIRAGGYAITYGVSWLMIATFGDDGPEARGLLVYGQSGDPASPHHVDQAEWFGAKRLRPLLFREADIAADPALVERTLTA